MTHVEIHNLLFDLGGVITDMKRERCAEALTALGVPDVDQMLGLYKQEGIFLQLEAGELSAAQFRDALRARIGHYVDDASLNQAVSAFIVGIPRHRLETLRLLRNRYRTFVLSNTNPIMFEGIIARQFEQEGLDINAYFDGVTVSYLAHSNKPDRGIFDYAVATTGIVPEHTLFLDDGEVNVEAARQLGFKAALVPPGTEFIDILKQLRLA